jgi:2-amino-4-hydroxy-6-hydroxymethyldihydropteridine diphosphokinase
LHALHGSGGAFLTAWLYQTEPRHCPPGSPRFLNTVIEMAVGYGAFDLLEKTRNIEIMLGRAPAAERNAPRPIDIDLLYLADEVIDHPLLALPHPRIAERRFVLEPLADIRPELVLPGWHAPVKETLDSLESDEPPLEIAASRWFVM